MNYVFYDFETSGNNKDFDQILQIGAVLTDEGFHIKDKINISCRLKKNIIPAPEALLINRISIDQLQSNKITHYELLEQLRKKFEEWSPACFVGFNSISFDEDVLRQGLFQSFNFPYLTSVKGNCRLDVLKLARAVSAFAPNSIAIPLGKDNKPSFKLGNLTKVNQVTHDNAHDAMGDVVATLELAKKIESVEMTEILSLGKSLELVKDIGDATVVANQYGLNNFNGTHGIGHTRMATESGVDIRSVSYTHLTLPTILLV